MKPLDDKRLSRLLKYKRRRLDSAIKDKCIRDVLTHNNDINNIIFDLYTVGCYDYERYQALISEYCLTPRKERNLIRKEEKRCEMISN